MGKIAFFICIALLPAFASQASADEPRCSAWADELSERRGFRYEQYFTKSHPEVDRMLEILWEEGVPARYLYLILAESNGRPEAISKAGAAGVWQLTRATAAAYGCKDRSDLESSTRAAARYLSKLIKDFNGDDWNVIAAYNQGGRNLRRHGATREAKALADLVTCLFLKDPFFLNGME